MTNIINVLFVDDEASILKSIERQLREMPYQNHFENDPKSAFPYFKEQPIDVLVTDEKMPGLSGLELVDQVKSQYPEVVCIMLTGEMSPRNIIKAMNNGVIYKYLAKPCNIVELVQAIESAVRAQAIKRQVQALIKDYKEKCNLLNSYQDIGDVDKNESGVIDLSEVDLDSLMRDMDSLGI